MVTSKDLVKEKLCEDTDLLINVLEHLGCHHISFRNSKEIRCALPDGTTASSVCIKLSKYMGCQIFSRSGFSEFEIRDILTLVQFIHGSNFFAALSWLCKETGIEYDGLRGTTESLDLLKEIKREKRKMNHPLLEQKHPILDPGILEAYRPTVVDQWVSEGVSAETQRKYGIRDDEHSCRWIIPIYDESGNLISVKGRTYAPNWDILGIQKYIYYYPLGTSDILFGLNFNKQRIIEKNELILFEAEKSVMAADSYGYGWGSSLGTNSISKPLFKKILAVPVANVVLAFDKDVAWEAAMKEARKLCRYKNVYIIFDRNGALTEKNSPTDKGKDIFETLYVERLRVRQ